MKTLTVGKLKAGFSQVIRDVENGEGVVVSFGKNQRNVAVIIPFCQYKRENPVTIGILEKKASFKLVGNLSFSDEEFLKS